MDKFKNLRMRGGIKELIGCEAKEAGESGGFFGGVGGGFVGGDGGKGSRGIVFSDKDGGGEGWQRWRVMCGRR